MAEVINSSAKVCGWNGDESPIRSSAVATSGVGFWQDNDEGAGDGDHEGNRELERKSKRVIGIRFTRHCLDFSLTLSFRLGMSE